MIKRFIKRNKIKLILSAVISSIILFNGCALIDYEVGQMKEALNGREAIIQTYDEESNIIDKIDGKSISISSEDKFDSKDNEGNTINKSAVLGLTVGGKSVVQVGSSLI